MFKKIILTGGLCLAATTCLQANEINSNNLIVVTAKRYEEPNVRSSSRLSVITQEGIQNSSAQTISELLQTTLGVHITDNSTLKSAVIDIRGMGEFAKQNVLILVDGRKINHIDISGADLIQIPVESIEKIEVLRGSGSVLYGDNAVGGVVNIITKNPEQETRVSLETFYGSHQTSGGSVQVSGGRDNIQGVATYRYFDTDGFRNNSDLLSKDVNVALDAQVSDRLSFELKAGYHEDQQRLPGGLNQTELATLGREGSANPNDFSETEEYYVDLGQSWLIFDHDNYSGSLDVNVNYRDRDVFSLLDFGFGFIGETDSRIQTAGFLTKYISEGELGGKNYKSILGFDYYDHENDIQTGGFSSDDLTISKEEIGVYGNIDVEMLDDFYVNLGARHHEAKYTFTQRAATARNEKQRPTEDVFSVGFKYDYAEQSNVFASIEKSFRFLATDEWYFLFPGGGLQTQLKQQSGLEYQTGIKHQVNPNYSVNATAYLMDIEDEIFFDPTLGGGFGLNSNYDDTRRIGMEIGNKYQKNDLSAFFNVTLQKAEFEGGKFVDNQIPLVPSVMWSAGFYQKFLKDFLWGMTVRYVGSQRAINDQENTHEKMKAYTVVDSTLKYDFEQGEFFVNLNNVFDKKYNVYESESPSSSARDVYPADGRNILVGVKLKF